MENKTTIQKLAEITDLKADYIAAAKIPEERLSAMFEKASSAKKWADRSFYAAATFMAAGIGTSWMMDNPSVGSFFSWAFIASAVPMIINSGRQKSVLKEIHRVAGDRLAELAKEKGAPKPTDI